MYNSGFILVYRDETEDWLFQDPQLYHWWLYLRMKATPKPCVQTVGRTRIRTTLNYGEFATTVSYLARVWDADERTVSSFLDLLEQDGRISIRREKNNISIINIKEYVRFSPPAGYFAKGVRRDMQHGSATAMPNETVNEMEVEMEGEMSHGMQGEVQAPMGPNKIILEEEKIKISSSSSTRERELEFFEELKASPITLEEMAKNFGLPDVSSVLAELEKFKSYLLPSGKRHKDFADFKIHFMNWHRRTAQNEQSKKYQNGRNEEKQGGRRGSAADRRGSEGSAQSADDYDAPFPTEG